MATSTPTPTLASLSATIAGLQASITALQNQAQAAKYVDTNNASSSSVSATPEIPKTPDYTIDKNPNVKIATSNLFVEPQTLTVVGLSNLLFQDFPTSELITNTSNFSLINGGSNDTISNIKSIFNEISSYTSSRLPDLGQTNSLKLSYFIPSVGNGSNGDTVYFDKENANIVIEVTNINSNELVEYQVISQSTILDATI